MFCALVFLETHHSRSQLELLCISMSLERNPT
ncbi:hypothetical protein T11_10598 [Trichinella zimbabwensis]|uniref:Uncharacterized protein n=1 Tax=Trichinella zimbabwensis TaxID=268475 RepID=A0A0V1G7R4_9BILA|nr:hypothetical protein T11_10598 [Trichinella zimbabwensis]